MLGMTGCSGASVRRRLLRVTDAQLQRSTVAWWALAPEKLRITVQGKLPRPAIHRTEAHRVISR